MKRVYPGVLVNPATKVRLVQLTPAKDAKESRALPHPSAWILYRALRVHGL